MVREKYTPVHEGGQIEITLGLSIFILEKTSGHDIASLLCAWIRTMHTNKMAAI